MAKIRTALSMLGSAKDAKKSAARFDDPSRSLPAESLFPPEEVRPPATEARTFLMRVTNGARGDGDIVAVVHTPVTRDSIAVFVFNPSIVVEAGTTMRELVDHSGYPVAVAIVEEFLGTRIDHIVELTADALAGVTDAVGPLATYSRTAFSADGVDFVEGTNRLDGAAARVFTAADPVDDAGQTRTRNQRALLRSLLGTLDVRQLVKDSAQLSPVLDAVVGGIAKDPGFTSAVVSQLATDLRSITRKDIVAVTVPASSERQEDGTVHIAFEADVLTALRESLTAGSPLEFASKLAEMGY